jgi:hypothetical protein
LKGKVEGKRLLCVAVVGRGRVLEKKGKSVKFKGWGMRRVFIQVDGES